jgi:hypothetical protein
MLTWIFMSFNISFIWKSQLYLCTSKKIRPFTGKVDAPPALKADPVSLINLTYLD